MNLVENKIFTEKTFTNCSLVPPKDAMPPKFAEETCTNSHKTSKFEQVFFLESFPLYSEGISQNMHCAAHSG